MTHGLTPYEGDDAADFELFDQPEFDLRREEMREEALSDHHERHPGHLTDRGAAAHRYDEELSFPVVDLVDQVANDDLRHLGHGLSKHTGQGRDELRDFPSYAGSGASSSDTPEQQARMIGGVLEERAPDVAEWLDGDGDDEMTFDAELGEATGRWSHQDLADPVEVTGGRVVLTRAPDDERGYAFLTAYPVPSDQVEQDDQSEVDVESFESESESESEFDSDSHGGDSAEGRG